MISAPARTRYLVGSLLIVGAVCSSHLANAGEWKGSQLEPRQGFLYIRIVRGLLGSNKIRHLSEIPSEVIHTLETNEGEAKKLIEELETGQVPIIIKDLPDEVIGACSDALGIFKSLPTEIINPAEAAVTDIVSVFNDIGSGAITSDLEKIPSLILSHITDGWGEFTAGLVDSWNAIEGITCIVENCPAATTTAEGSCGSNQAITAQASFQTSLPPRSSAISPIPPPCDVSPSPAVSIAGGFRIDSTILRRNLFQLC